MELTRRDAIAALAAAGVAVGTGSAALRAIDEDAPDIEAPTASGEAPAEVGEDPIDEVAIRTLVAAADVLYPSAVENTAAFVTRYVRGRAAARPEHAAGVADAVAYLDDWVEAWYDASFAELDPSTREAALRRMNADTADPDPDGSDVERVRYYVVNELLFALYASPTGASLVGLENPQGYPGGLSSYQRGPQP